MYKSISSISLAVLCLVGLLQFSACNGVADQYTTYPPASEVVEWYNVNIGRKPLSPAELKLIKNPEGYFLVTEEVLSSSKTEQTHAPVQIWSTASGEFTMLSDEDQDLLGPVNPDKRRPFRVQESMYDENLFFGYKDWPHDVIAEIEGKTGENARLWYGLARAYSALGTAVLSHRADASQSHPYDESLDLEAFKEEDLDKHQELMRKGIDAFHKAAGYDPKMEVIVGNIAVKAANDYMTAWLDLSIIGQNERAKAFLKADLYPSSYTSAAKNLLSSCGPNAILFTYGDVDTYTTLYVQAQSDFRRDVSVVNLSLLNTSRYIHYLAQLLPTESRLPISLSKDEYKGETNSFKKAEAGYQLVLPPAPDDFPRFKGDSLQSSIRILVRGGQMSYLLKQDLLLLDIVEQNAWKRPIYFGDGVDPGSKLGLGRICRLSGLATQITPYLSDLPETAFRSGLETLKGAPHADPGFEMFTGKFVFEGLSSEENRSSILNEHAVRSLKSHFFSLLEALAYSGDSIRFKVVLDQYLRVFPPETKELPDYRIAAIGYYAEEMGQETASKRLFKAAETLSNDFLDRLKRKEDYEQGELITAMMNAFFLRDSYEKSGQEAAFLKWKKKYETLAKEYEKSRKGR